MLCCAITSFISNIIVSEINMFPVISRTPKVPGGNLLLCLPVLSKYFQWMWLTSCVTRTLLQMWVLFLNHPRRWKIVKGKDPYSRPVLFSEMRFYEKLIFRHSNSDLRNFDQIQIPEQSRIVCCSMVISFNKYWDWFWSSNVLTGSRVSPKNGSFKFKL